jgi:hypothetical protein
MNNVKLLKKYSQHNKKKIQPTSDVEGEVLGEVLRNYHTMETTIGRSHRTSKA